ncbi:substrate-binding domain-containing protein [Anaerolineales bacterium HSG24]|nr:substrate-binding domain-containing protein [Anaerolineales bacterium HSG24]
MLSKNICFTMISIVIFLFLLSACSQTQPTVNQPEAIQEAETVIQERVLTSIDSEKISSEITERGFFLLPEFHALVPNQETAMNEFLKVVQADPVPTSTESSKPIKIAFIFPSLEESDAWARLNTTIRKRLDVLKIPYDVTEYLVENGDHEGQSAQIDEILKSDFDYVVIGPSEYQQQKENLGRLAEKFPTLIMNVVNPFVDSYATDKMPLTHVGFDHSVGAKALCEWVIKETGGEGTFGLVRYVIGLVDDQRSNVFADCVQENSNMTMVAEYEANGERNKAFIGANVILTEHPDITMLHGASTAIALGNISALEEQGVLDHVIVNGWGGGADELNAIIEGKLDVTPFRVNDDWGVSVAEAIRAHVEGREADIPVVIAATIKIVDYHMSAEDIAKETETAFRYSGDLN